MWSSVFWSDSSEVGVKGFFCLGPACVLVSLSGVSDWSPALVDLRKHHKYSLRSRFIFQRDVFQNTACPLSLSSVFMETSAAFTCTHAHGPLWRVCGSFRRIISPSVLTERQEEQLSHTLPPLVAASAFASVGWERSRPRVLLRAGLRTDANCGCERRGTNSKMEGG